jgi:hypothetical protein
VNRISRVFGSFVLTCHRFNSSILNQLKALAANATLVPPSTQSGGTRIGMNKSHFVILVLIVSVLIGSGCNKNSDDPVAGSFCEVKVADENGCSIDQSLVGTWLKKSSIGEEETTIFRADGTSTYAYFVDTSGNDESWELEEKWCVKNGLLFVEFDSPGDYDKDSSSFGIVGDLLIVGRPMLSSGTTGNGTWTSEQEDCEEEIDEESYYGTKNVAIVFDGTNFEYTKTFDWMENGEGEVGSKSLTGTAIIDENKLVITITALETTGDGEWDGPSAGVDDDKLGPGDEVECCMYADGQVIDCDFQDSSRDCTDTSDFYTRQ